MAYCATDYTVTMRNTHLANTQIVRRLFVRGLTNLGLTPAQTAELAIRLLDYLREHGYEAEIDLLLASLANKGGLTHQRATQEDEE